jgi:ribosomal protein S18 acetylase RimI-like enzyme
VSTIELRPATAADAPRLSEIVQAAYGPYVERLGRPRPMLDDYAEVISRDQVIVASRGGELVGLVVLQVGDEGFVVDNVAVDPVHKGTGVGRALLERGEAEARRAGFDSIALYTHELMTENLALYTRIRLRRVRPSVDRRRVPRLPAQAASCRLTLHSRGAQLR